jgi:transcriptional regulator with XRE-family HTH domain
MTRIDRERLGVLELLATLPAAEWGRRLRAARKAAGLTGTEAARRAGMAVGDYFNAEAGRFAMTAPKLWRLASTLKLDPAILFAGPEPAMETAGGAAAEEA